MGVLDRFEKGIERAVNGAFAKAFRSEVQPVEIASALRRECDDRAAIVGRDRTVAPNTFVVELGPADAERLAEWRDALGDELAAAVHNHAVQQRYAFVGPVTVTFDMARDLDTGVFRIRSSTTRQQGAAAGPAGPAGPGPGGPPQVSGGPGAPLPPPPGYQPAPLPPAPVAQQPQVQPAYPPLPPPPGAQPAAAAPTAWAQQVPQPAPVAAPQTATLDVDGRMYRVTAPVTVIGRATEADIVLDDPGVSRRHAEVHLVDGRARVIDLGSTNGTFVDGERVHAETLSQGSVITIGRTRIVFHQGQW